MKEDFIHILEVKNKAIIDSIILKSQSVCPNSIALIGVYGSFHTGDVHEKSDLDLCIVINNDEGWKVGSCFILDEIGYDIYCTYWEQLENISKYDTPQLSKLLDLTVVYSADEKYLAKLKELQNVAQKVLDAPINGDDLGRVEKQFGEGLKAYANLMLSDDIADCFLNLSDLLHYVENTLFILNKKRISFSIKRMPDEINKLEKLPQDFADFYSNCINSLTVDEIKRNSTQLLNSLKTLVETIKSSMNLKQKLTADSLRGSYEEAFSNWQNKMTLAEQTENRYLGLMTAASFQTFYNDFREEYDMPAIDVLSEFSKNDFSEQKSSFLKGMETLEKLYDENHAPIVTYANLEEFKAGYLGKE